MQMSTKMRIALMLTTAAAPMLLATAAQAQAVATPAAAGAADNGIAEVVVTARLREEKLQDVPVAVSVQSGATLRERGVERLDALSRTVPNVRIRGDVATSIVRVRGVAGGPAPGFEQPVGQIYDGFFSSRAQLIRMPFIDVAQIQVLKGPQGALIGKNTTAGAIVVNSNQPTKTFEAFGQAGYEKFDGAGDGFIGEGSVSGPISDTVKARFALRRRTGGAWLNDPAAGIKIPDNDDWSGRGIVDWAPSSRIDFNLFWSHADLNSTGSARILAYCSPAFLAVMQANAKSPYNCGPPGKLSSERGPINGQGNFDWTKTKINFTGLTTKIDLGGGFTLASLSGFAAYATHDFTEGDRTEFEVVNQELREKYSQWSQEFRLLSPTGGQFEYLIGAFYQHRKLKTIYAQHFNVPASPFFAITPPQFKTAFANVTDSSESGNSYAAFGSVTWNIVKNWSLSVDGRYTHEKSNAQQDGFVDPVYRLEPTLRTRTLIPFVTAGRSESDFSPGAVLQWKPQEGVMLYASVRKGFKGGGYNLSRSTTTDAFQFEPEKVTSYEAGAKTTMFDRRLQLNISAFDEKFTNLQVASVNNSGGVPITTTTNAAAVNSSGVEADAVWTPLHGLTFTGAVGFLHAVYDNFIIAACFRGQTVAQGCVNSAQSLNGRQVEESPKFTGTFDGQYKWGLSSSMDLAVYGLAAYTGSYYVNQDGDPGAGSGNVKPTQDSYWYLESRITLSAANQKWAIALVGRNLADKLLNQAGGILPGVLPAARAPRTIPGRSWLLQGTLRY
jgi:iron complex outermembrane receptor protein